MGGSSADRLTGQTGGVDGDTLAATGGAETHVLTTAQLATHTHGATKSYNSDPGLTNTRFSLVTEQTDREDSFPGYQTTTGDTNNIISTTGSGSAHNNVQPTIILNYIIKI